jgi:hypothetical protein
VALLVTGFGAASPAADPGACVVVLECAGSTLSLVPNEDGSFVFQNVPAGACTVRVAPAPSSSAAEPAPVDAAGSSSSSRSVVVAPRDAASGLPTGKRQHKPLRYTVTLDGEPSSFATRTAEEWSAQPLHVSSRKGGREIRGHVTLMK